jgi:hypothetical protein
MPALVFLYITRVRRGQINKIVTKYLVDSQTRQTFAQRFSEACKLQFLYLSLHLNGS